MDILDCSVVRDSILADVKKELINVKKDLGIAVISIGNVLVNEVYLRAKRKMFSSLEIKFMEYKLDSDIKEDEVIELIDMLNNDNSIDGIMIELPIEGNFDVSKIINRIDYRKDVDGLTDVNRIRLEQGMECLVSSTVKGIMEILKYYNLISFDKRIVVVGNGYLVGKPLSMVFENNNIDFLLCDSKTSDLEGCIKQADILISGVGIKGIIRKDMLKEGVVVIDAGVSVDDGIVVGDVERLDLDSVKGMITPLTLGVGVVTTASLIKNLVKSYYLMD